MAAPLHPDGYLSGLVNRVRTYADHSSRQAQFTNQAIVEEAWKSLETVLTDVYPTAATPPTVEFPINVVSGTDRYAVPPNLGELNRIYLKDTATGVITAEFWPRHQQDLGGPNVYLEDGVLRFRPIPTGNITCYVSGILSGAIPMHQNLSPLFSGTNDTGTQLLTTTNMVIFPTTTDWLIGTFDRRPNAYIGRIVRILGTVNSVSPTGYGFFPIQERVVTAQSFVSNRLQLTFDRPLDFNPNIVVDKVTISGYTTVTQFVYEIVPSIDYGIFTCLEWDVARRLLSLEGSSPKLTTIRAEYEHVKRAVALRMSNSFLAGGGPHRKIPGTHRKSYPFWSVSYGGSISP